MSTATANSQTTVVFTERAARKARELLSAQPDPGGGSPLALRVYIEGGGCSGFQYGFDLESEVEPDDLVVEKDGVKLLVDPMSAQYLTGAEIDFKEDLMGAQFVVTNPNASTTCGCGMSFSV